MPPCQRDPRSASENDLSRNQFYFEPQLLPKQIGFDPGSSQLARGVARRDHVDFTAAAREGERNFGNDLQVAPVEPVRNPQYGGQGPNAVTSRRRQRCVILMSDGRKRLAVIARDQGDNFNLIGFNARPASGADHAGRSFVMPPAAGKSFRPSNVMQAGSRFEGQKIIRSKRPPRFQSLKQAPGQMGDVPRVPRFSFKPLDQVLDRLPNSGGIHDRRTPNRSPLEETRISRKESKPVSVS